MMVKFFVIFAVVFIITNIVSAVGYLKRIAETLEDFVYNDDDTEESNETET